MNNSAVQFFLVTCTCMGVGISLIGGVWLTFEITERMLSRIYRNMQCTAAFLAFLAQRNKRKDLK